jgi:hypothetical protein
MKMKTTKLKYTGLMLMLLLAIPACKKYEPEPLENLTHDYIFDDADRNAVYAQQYLNNVYSYIPNGFNRIDGNVLDAGTDDAIPTRNATTIDYFTNGRLSATNYPDPAWGNSYAGIRRVNIFLKNIDVVPADDVQKQYWKAEARFIRALLYFEMLKRYGGIPLIGDQIFAYDTTIDFKRNTFEECVNYIVAECDDIKTKLRPEPLADTDLGKIAIGAALALKSRLLLYAASPLYNGGGFEGDISKKALAGYPTADPARWQKAIDAAKELIDLGKYSLEASYLTPFIARKSVETILARQRAKTFDIETNNAPVGFNSDVSANKGLTSPTEELAEAFGTTKGKTIVEDVKSVTNTTGYDATSPFVNRDSRFATTFFFNGSDWLKRKVETFDGGLDKPGGVIDQTKTGYYMRKFMANFATSTAYTTQDHNFIIFRYAEILLNYAEALNENGRTEEAVTQIGLIRKRAAITAGSPARYGIKVGISKDEMRTLIQNERRVELAFEEHRFWDLRRWKIGEQVLNGKLHGLRGTKGITGTVTYAPYEASSVVFTPKMYHMPLPYSEITKDQNLVQNEGW